MILKIKSMMQQANNEDNKRYQPAEGANSKRRIRYRYRFIDEARVQQAAAAVAPAQSRKMTLILEVLYIQPHQKERAHNDNHRRNGKKGYPKTT